MKDLDILMVSRTVKIHLYFQGQRKNMKHFIEENFEQIKM